MKRFFPQKSLFGFPLLSSWQSTFGAYGMLIPMFVLLPLFGDDPHELKAGYLFLLLLNVSTLILTFNSIQQKKNNYSLLWIIINIPLWCLVPMETSFLIYGIKGLI